MKKILKLFIPPIIIKLYNLVINYNFKKFWKKNKKNFSDNHEFKIMFDFFVNSANYKFVSNYWHYLNIKHLQELLSNKKDLKDYSTSIAKNTLSSNLYSSDVIFKGSKLLPSVFLINWLEVLNSEIISNL